MSIERKFKVALDETRLLMMGSQILFGFEFHAVFQQTFGRLPVSSKIIDGIALLLMALAIALLIAPGTQHRLSLDGQITPALIRSATVFTGWALLPFAVSLGLDVYVALAKNFGASVGAAAAAVLTLLALLLWYGLEAAYRLIVLKGRHMSEIEADGPTPLPKKIEEMLTEARIAIPGAQALLGFQLLVALTDEFPKFPLASQVVHALALGCVALALLLLVAPAAFHRLAFQGADTEPVFRFGSRFVTAALLPLALGISGDIYVSLARIGNSVMIGMAASLSSLLLYLFFWYVQPLLLRNRFPIDGC